MRKIILESSVSLDGFVEGPRGEMDWLIGNDRSGDVFDFLSVFDTAFFGRRTYERFGAPHDTDGDLTSRQRHFADVMYGLRKYVFSRTIKHVEGNGMVISRNVEAEVRRIRSEEGKNIWFCGGPDLLKTFGALDLIDEYLISVHPVLLRSGKPLFQDQTALLHNLVLVEKRDLASGIVILHYCPHNRLEMYNHDRSL